MSEGPRESEAVRPRVFLLGTCRHRNVTYLSTPSSFSCQAIMETSVTGRKIVVLGIPWDVETEGLRDYMSEFGAMDDIIVMKDRATGKSRGFGYVTFATAAQAEKVISQTHMLKDRRLEVKMATPKEEMTTSKQPESTRIFVARVPQSISEASFRSYFADYGSITDCYMPKDPTTKAHRGIGFVTFDSSSSVDKVMEETHQMDGSPLAVDRATPKDDSQRFGRSQHFHGAGQQDMRLMAYGSPGGSYPGYGRQPMMNYGSHGLMNSSLPGVGQVHNAGSGGSPGSFGNGVRPTNEAKVFVGKLPAEASAQDLRDYFGRFGPIEDVYIPKELNKSSHRGFGFVTFVEEAVAAFVAGRPHTICGRAVAVDRATPPEGGGGGAGGASGAAAGGAGGPVRGLASAAAAAAAAAAAGSFYSPQAGYGTAMEQLPYGAYADYAPPGTTDFSSGIGRSAPRYRPY